MAVEAQRSKLPWPRTRRARRALTGYMFISPFILGFLLFFVGPALVAAWLTMFDWNMIRPPYFIGLGNFKKMFADDLFYQSLKVTAYFSLVSVPVGLVLSFFLALLMNFKTRSIAVFRTIYYLPSIVPAVANAVLWSFILNTEFGLLNALLDSIGLPKIAWLQEPEWAMPAIILMSLWALGATMVIYLAGLQGIPRSLYEAAEIDGAGRWASLVNVTIPLMSPVIFFNLIIGIIGSFQIFTAGFLITGGGPQHATLFYVLYIYRNGLQYFDMGYASLLAWVLFFLIFALTLLVFKYVGRYVYYEDVGT
ncbi:MAG: sugar ABC transporter permease [Caldilineaceae bacterium]|nr:sugar ABC transporter permease [Caldilineaceae bacterium]